MDRTQIKNMAYAPTYQKGQQLFQQGDVWEFDVDEDGDFDDINAVVKGSGRNLYQVEVCLNTAEDEIESIDCECPAFSEYAGICKHCVAVLLEYVHRHERQQSVNQYAAKREESLRKLQQMQRGMVRHTAQPMKKLLENRGTRRSLPYVRQEHLGQVELVPFLYVSSEGVKVEFKIGITQLYVLKDVVEFAARMETGEYYSYGKKLVFSHVEENFTERSKPYVKFINTWVRENASAYQEYRYYYSYGSPKIREIPLDGLEMEKFLDAMGTDEISGTVGGQRSQFWHVEPKAPKRGLVIQGQADGIELKLAPMPTCRGRSHYICFDEGCIYRIPKEQLEPVEDFMDCLDKMRSLISFVEKADIPSFCRNLLPELKQAFQCEIQNFDEKEYGVEPVALKVYLDLEGDDMITFKGIAAYGEKEYLLYEERDLRTRNLPDEMALRKVIDRYTNAYDNQRKIMVLSGDEELLYELLTRGIQELSQVAEVFVSESLKRIHVVRVPKVTVGVSLSGELLKLELTAGEMPKDQLIELLSRYQRKKKFYRLKNGDIIKVQDAGLEELKELQDGLQLSDRQLAKDEIEVPRYRSLYMDAQLKESKVLSSVRNSDFRRLVENMKTVEENDFVIPGELEHVLREYQKTGFLWLKTLNNNGFGGILADDMGLGKTIQVIAFLLSEYQEIPAGTQKRTLIVTPASLVYNWQNEFGRFAPGLKVRVIAGNAAEREALIRQSGKDEILITSYDLLKRDLEYYEGMNFGYEVIDEAQFIKNHGTQAAKAVKEIRAQFKLALTGTPIENRLGELWSIFDYLMPGFLFSERRFREEFEKRIIKEQDEKAMARLQKMIAPFVLRRLKRDVLKDLPEKSEENLYVRLEGEQQELYDAHVKRIQIMLKEKSDEDFKNSKLQILAELTKLRQLCCDPALVFDGYQGDSAKLDACIQLVQSAVSNQHKVLLFSQFTSMLERIQDRLRRENISFYVLTGATSKEKRQELVRAFQTDETEVFCISLKAGGTGLNLTAADIVIHYDPWWNVAAQNQATDRAHRIGQENPVTVYKLISQGTIEENIMKLQERKQELADEVLSGSGTGAASITREELLELLR